MVNMDPIVKSPRLVKISINSSETCFYDNLFHLWNVIGKTIRQVGIAIKFGCY